MAIHKFSITFFVDYYTNLSVCKDDLKMRIYNDEKGVKINTFNKKSKFIHIYSKILS